MIKSVVEGTFNAFLVRTCEGIVAITRFYHEDEQKNNWEQLVFKLFVHFVAFYSQQLQHKSAVFLHSFLEQIKC